MGINIIRNMNQPFGIDPIVETVASVRSKCGPSETGFPRGLENENGLGKVIEKSWNMKN